MKALVLVIALLWPLCAVAQSLPALFNVTDVEEDDVLNIRSEPGIGADIIGALAPDARDIEVVERDESEDWGKINIDEGTGWVALRYLRRQPGQTNDVLPRPLACSGTEPFWTFTVESGPEAEFQWLGEPPQKFDNLFSVNSSNRTDRHAILADGEQGVLTSVFRQSLCSDGMSDRVYGLSVDIFLTGENDVEFFSGCCSVAP